LGSSQLLARPAEQATRSSATAASSDTRSVARTRPSSAAEISRSKPPPCRCQGEPRVAALQQGNAEQVLEFAHLLTDGAVRDAQLLRRVAHVQVPADRLERTQGVQW
jgi:hypothetical protein